MIIKYFLRNFFINPIGKLYSVQHASETGTILKNQLFEVLFIKILTFSYF